MSKSLVIIPTYNEIENISKMIDKVMSLPDAFDVLIVDDNSPDGTAQVVIAKQKQYPPLHLLSRAGKQGLGKAYIAGFEWALTKDYDYIFEMDCDFSHNPEDLIRLKKGCEESGGMSVGSRYIKGGKLKNWPIGRILMSYFASVYVRMILWINVVDTTAGFVCYKKEALQALDLSKIQFMGYAFQIEMKYNILKKGFKIKEVPITFIDRVEGHSKMSTKIFKEAFIGVLKMRLGN
jgi:dolichol-phosphate mannosyltransferase